MLRLGGGPDMFERAAKFTPLDAVARATSFVQTVYRCYTKVSVHTQHPSIQASAYLGLLIWLLLAQTSATAPMGVQVSGDGQRWPEYGVKT